MINYLVLLPSASPACFSLLRWSHWPWISSQICMMSWLDHLSPVILFPICVKYICCARARYLGTKPRIIYAQQERRDKFVNCVWSFPYPVTYRSALVKRVVISGYIFQFSNHFHNVSTDAVHLPRIPSWVYWYRCFIASGTRPHHGQILVDACPCCYIIVMLDRVLLIHFVMKCDIWTVFLSRARSNGERSILSQSSMWASFWSTQYWRSQCLEISQTVD